MIALVKITNNHTITRYENGKSKRIEESTSTSVNLFDDLGELIAVVKDTYKQEIKAPEAIKWDNTFFSGNHELTQSVIARIDSYDAVVEWRAVEVA